MSEFVKIVLPLFLGLVALLVFFRWVMAAVRHRMDEHVRRRFAGRSVVRRSIGANFFGQLSRGMGQVRGNGALVLTPEELYFVLAVPRRELTIPLSAVTSVSTPRSHLGKTVGMRLLRVDFEGDQGEDAAAWALNGVDEWKAAIDRYRPPSR